MYILKLHHDGWDENYWDLDIGITENLDANTIHEFNMYADDGKSAKCVEILERYITFLKGPAKRRIERVIGKIREQSAEEIADYKLWSCEIYSLDQ